MVVTESDPLRTAAIEAASRAWADKLKVVGLEFSVVETIVDAVTPVIVAATTSRIAEAVETKRDSEAYWKGYDAAICDALRSC